MQKKKFTQLKFNFEKKINKKAINKIIQNSILDLWAKDIVSLISANRHAEAVSVGKYLGVPKKEITKLIQEHKNL